MELWKQLLYSVIEEDDELAKTLKRIAQELGLTLKEIANEANIPLSTLYKISSSESDNRISTLKKLVIFVRDKERDILVEKIVVGLITSRDVLDRLGSTIELEGELIHIKEYLANTIEEEITQGVRAVKEGVKAIVCGPIAANTLKKIVDIPVVGISFSRNSLVEAIRKAQPKF